MNWLKREEINRARHLLEGYSEDDSHVFERKEHALPQTSLLFLNELLIYAGINQKEARKIQLKLTCLVSAVVFASFIMGNWLIVLLAPAIVFNEYQRLKRKAFARAASFEKDYTALLLSLASGVRTGLDPLSALCASSDLFASDSEIKKELEKLKIQIDDGASEESAVKGFASSINHPDIRLFTTAFILARKEGSSLSECLQRLAKVTRQRQSFRRKVRGAVAMQRLSAFGIGGCTIVIGLIQYTTNPEAMIQAVNHPLGFKTLAIGMGLITFGLVWMLNMSKSKI